MRLISGDPLTDERREYNRQKMRKHRKDKQRHIEEFKAMRGCEVCGEDDPVVLQLDHIDPSTKTRNNPVTGGTTWTTLSWPALEEELAKCQVLCANCHCRKTARDREETACG